jgi:muconolactone delta-isomerase
MWTIVRDHKNLKIYFKSFANETIQMVDVKKLLAHPNQKIYLSSGDWYKEVTK